MRAARNRISRPGSQLLHTVVQAAAEYDSIALENLLSALTGKRRLESTPKRLLAVPAIHIPLSGLNEKPSTLVVLAYEQFRRLHWHRSELCAERRTVNSSGLDRSVDT